MTHMAVYALGSFQVLRNDEIVTKRFRTAKERALLAYLAIETEHPHGRETLGELFWPGRPEGTARTSLRQALSGVRSAIGDRNAPTPYLSVSDENVQLNPQRQIWSDVKAFENHIQATLVHNHTSMETCPVCAQHLEEAISLYRGDFLAETYLAGCQRFQEWMFFQREHYARHMLMALGNLSRYDQQRNDLESALKYARQHVSLAPLEENAHRQLMRLLVQAGLRGAALEQYLTCQRILGQELGVMPAPETTALFELIKQGLPLEGSRLQTASPASELPIPLTSFVDRQSEMEWFAECLPKADQRLVTITGMPGVGKTRLALEAARASADHFPDGVHFVALNRARNAAEVIECIASALGLSPQSHRDPQQALLATLGRRQILLVLDQFEHLHNHTHLLLELLRRSPGLKLVVTSRRCLNIQSACLLQLGGLDYPGSEQLSKAMDFSAVQLFCQRASRRQPGFQASPENLYEIVRICQLVDGHPLALELAAAALRDHSCAQLAEQLSQGSQVLQTSLQDVPARHRSIRAALDIAWTALSGPEKKTYRRVAVFEGCFSLEAAQVVCGASEAELNGLVDQSMLCGCCAQGYAFQVLIKGHARAKLSANPQEAEELKLQHSQYYLELVKKVEHSRAEPVSQDQGEGLQPDANLDDLRLAMQTAAQHGQASLVDFDGGGLENFTGFATQEEASWEAQETTSGLYDPLTQLPNQALFYDRIRYSLSLAVRESRQFAVLLLDLDNFKAINRDFSRQRGDAVLQRIAERLRACLRVSDTLARTGDDEFGMILENLSSSDNAKLVAGKIMAEMGRPYLLDGAEVWITASIGVCCYPQGGQELEDLLACAAAALQQVKNNGRNGFLVSQPSQLQRSSEPG